MPSRLPQPPRTGSRPLPPAPTADDHDNPPPLPSRPAPSRGGGGGKPPPPRQNGRAMPQQRNVRQPSTSDSSDESSEEEANYDDLDEQPMPSRPAPFQHQPQAPTEIYDDLEGTQPAAARPASYGMQEETYDGCQFESEPTAQEPNQDDFYTCADEGLPAPPAEQDSELYEFAPDSGSSASPPPPPVPSSVPRRAGLPLPSPSQPPLPNRPLPPRVDQPEESSDVNPKVKKLSAEGAKGLGISLADLDITRLKKVVTTVKPAERDPKIYEIEDDGDIKTRINKFKQKSEDASVKPAVKDEENGSGGGSENLQSQISMMRNMLKPSKAVGSNPKPNVPNSPFSGHNPSAPTTIVSPPADTSKLTMQQRIALLSGKPINITSAGGSAPVKPPLVAAIKPSQMGPSTPLKPLPAVRNRSPTPSPKPSPPTKPMIAQNKPEPVSQPPSAKWCSSTHGSPRSEPTKPEPTPVVKPAEEPLPQPPEEFTEDDIYDEAMSAQIEQDPLQGYDWFHGKIDRKVAEQRLGDIGQDGTFLVRNSTKDDARQPYTLVVLFMGHNFNLIVRVRDKDKQVALGSEKPDEMAFKDVVELIEYHKKNPVIVVNKQLGQQETLLKKNPINRRR